MKGINVAVRNFSLVLALVGPHHNTLTSKCFQTLSLQKLIYSQAAIPLLRTKSSSAVVSSVYLSLI